MCLVSSSKKPLIAKKNILVYKFVGKENNKYISPFQRTNLISNTTKQRKDIEKFGFRRYHIRGGYIHAYLDYEAAENWINLAFRWNNTDEGFEFWNALSNKWKKAVSSKTVTIQLKSCNKGNTEISLDVVTALERMGYVADRVKVE